MMSPIGFRLSVLTLLAAFLVGAANPAVIAQADGVRSSHAAQPTLAVVQSTSQILELDLTLPPFDIQMALSDRGACSQVRIPGWGVSGGQGEPAIPITGALVGLPPEGQPQVTVLDTGPLHTLEDILLCPVASGREDSQPGVDDPLPQQLWINPAAYDQQPSVAAPWVKFGEEGQIRSQRVAPLHFQPFRYDPLNRLLTYTSRIRVRVEFDPPVSPAGSPRVDEGMYEPILQSILVNYPVAQAWRTRPVRLPSPADVPDLAYKILVDQDGIYSLSYPDLLAAGLPVASLDPRTLRLHNQGEEVALHIPGQQDGVFDPADSILFYGLKNRTIYSDTNVYGLTWGAENGLRMTLADGTPAGASVAGSFRAVVRRDENKLYSPIYFTGPEEDHWFWEVISSSVPISKNYTIHLSHSAASGTPARLRGALKGLSANPYHHTRIYLNNHLLVEDTWPAAGAFEFDVEVDRAFLLEGANTIRVECPMTDGSNPIFQETLYVNWFEVEYSKTYAGQEGQFFFSGDQAGVWQFEITDLSSNDRLVFDISDPIRPLYIANPVYQPDGGLYTLSFQQDLASKREYAVAAPVDYLVPAGILPAQAEDLHVAHSADFIIISHPDFLDAIQPLVDYRAGQGLRVKAVNVMDIYDEFNFGVYNPRAIQDFVAYAYHNWQPPAPGAILLVGDSNYDFKNFLGLNQPIYIPPYLAYVDPWLGEVAADNRYVTVSGSDLLPDLSLGRLPVKTTAEVDTVVQKILANSASSQADWSARALFVAGKDDPAAGNFPVTSDEIITAYLEPRGVDTERVYYSLTHADAAAARLAILDAVNQGRGIVHFTGHSTPLGWYGDPINPSASILFSTATVPSLVNNGRLPFFISMTCLVGNFNNPYIQSLDEALLLAPNSGSIASWSPAGKGLAPGHDLLDHGLFQAVYHQGVTRLGQATDLAKYFLYANSTYYNDLLDTFVLLGDPAIRLQVDTRIYLPVVVR